MNDSTRSDPGQVRLDKDGDPMLTAYALGEADDVQRARIDLLLKGPDGQTLRDEIAAIRALGQTLGSELGLELQQLQVPALTHQQHAAIREAARASGHGRTSLRLWMRLGTPLIGAALAAGLLLLAMPGRTPDAPGPGSRDNRVAAVLPPASNAPLKTTPGSMPDQQEQFAQLDRRSSRALPSALARPAPGVIDQAPEPRVETTSAGAEPPDQNEAVRVTSAPPARAKDEDRVAAVRLPGELRAHAAVQTAPIAIPAPPLSPVQTPPAPAVVARREPPPVVPPPSVPATHALARPDAALREDAFAHRHAIAIGAAQGPFKSAAAAAAAPSALASPDKDVLASLRLHLRAGQVPPPAQVRVREWIQDHTLFPIAPSQAGVVMSAQIGPNPWRSGHLLALVSVTAPPPVTARHDGTSVLIVVNGSRSMRGPDCLGALQGGLHAWSKAHRTDTLQLASMSDQVQVLLHNTQATPAQRDQGIDQLGEALPPGERGALDSLAGVVIGLCPEHIIYCTDSLTPEHDAALRALVGPGSQVASMPFGLSVLALGAHGGSADALEQLAQAGHGGLAYATTPAEVALALKDLCAARPICATKVTTRVVFNPAVFAQVQPVAAPAALSLDAQAPIISDGTLQEGQTVCALYDLTLRTGITTRFREPRDLGPTAGEPQATGAPVPHPLRPQINEAGMSFAHALEGTLSWSNASGADPQEVTLAVETATVSADASGRGDWSYAMAVIQFAALIGHDPAIGTTWQQAFASAAAGLGSDSSGQRHRLIEVMHQVEELQKEQLGPRPAVSPQR